MLKITKPTLLLNEKIARQNIKALADKAKTNEIPLRPHFKTHVSLEIGEWFREEGVNSCTVSSVEMALYFADNWQDITIAFPLNRLEIEQINRLAANITLNLVIEDIDSLKFLQENLQSDVNYFIKIDVGTHRTGLAANHDFSSLITKGKRTNFIGFLAHAGHAYRCRNHAEITNVYEEVSKELKMLKDNYPDSLITYGDTPTCSVIDSFENIDELRAGNFVFYDWMQFVISSCIFDQIAVCMAVPVVAKHPERNEIVIHGGAIHFSKDQVALDTGERVFGALVNLTENGWEKRERTHYLTKVSQEHGILRVSHSQDFDAIKVGDLIGVIPVHSCLAANLMGQYQTLEGKEIIHMNKSHC